MAISISEAELQRALPKLGPGLNKYLWLQSQISGAADFQADPIFRRRFNGFYRVRRGNRWQDAFYTLMANAKGLPFREVLNALHASTGRLEVSFASKLVASLDPSFPVIDAFVLKNVGLKLPPANCGARLDRACEVYDELCLRCADFLKTPDGRLLVHEFCRVYPNATVSEMKMLDLVLWQTRG